MLKSCYFSCRSRDILFNDSTAYMYRTRHYMDKGTRQDQTADESKQTKTYNFWQNTQKTEKETLFCTINLNVWAKTFFSTSYFVFSLSIYAHSKSMALFWL